MHALQAELFKPTLEQQFAAFHRSNPHVYEALVAEARELKKLGVRQISIRDLVAFVRRENIRIRRTDDFRINNNHTSRFARLIIEKHPELRDVIAVRELKRA